MRLVMVALCAGCLCFGLDVETMFIPTLTLARFGAPIPTGMGNRVFVLARSNRHDADLIVRLKVAGKEQVVECLPVVRIGGKSERSCLADIGEANMQFAQVSVTE